MLNPMEDIELAISVIDSGIIEHITAEIMAIPCIMATSETLGSSLSKHLSLWKNKVKKKILSEPIALSLSKEIEYFNQVQLYSEEYFFNHIKKIINDTRVNSLFKKQALKLLNNNTHNSLFRDHFFDHWNQSIFSALQKTQIDSLLKEKQKLLKDLYQRQETISKLTEIDANINPQNSMRLWDMAKAKLTKINVQTLKRTAKLLSKHSELQKIADQLGRMANQHDDPCLNRTEVHSRRIKESTSPFTGDIVGIKQSADLERLLPIELMFLSDSELDVLFYKNLIEKRLSTYQQQNKHNEFEQITQFKQQPKKAEQDKGPFIIAIDASGSMMGSAEKCAKAFAYGLMKIALAQNRECYVILFSAQQITYELSNQHGLSEILNFLSYSFHGGTDLTSVLESAFKVMETEKYKNADLIVISDFITPPMSSKTIDKLNKLKEKSNRFHALSLSRYQNTEVLALFDKNWQYNPSKLANIKRFFHT
ncbi:hypothetical protein PCNPT3_00205 [Psychromonas sp. CNPT3]|uniref:VWA domain-containing protein n=1 Tax=Psychromonas sp. CNPT3 TaxID=314282 RepID=UPI0002C13F11|nr:VWA domain-containing protein [Psychromonas sp. CNPT3]AGH79983.1 hypothetical protein PCNPT3_00205 [Psychromonas sp. CNPT3]